MTKIRREEDVMYVALMVTVAAFPKIQINVEEDDDDGDIR